MAEIFFPEKMEHTEGMNADEILKIHDDYIRYIVERIDFAFNGYTNKKKFFQAVEDVVEDGPLAKELENEKSAREQAIDQLNEKLQDAGGLFTTVDPETGIVYMHDKKEEPGLLPPYTESRNVIMISTAGIAVSNDGGVTYPMGFTLDDGVAILNKIYAIGIDADHITTGRITDAQGNYSLDLETGTVNMANANITGGSINIETASESIDSIKLMANITILSHIYSYLAAITPSGYTAQIDFGEDFGHKTSTGYFGSSGVDFRTSDSNFYANFGRSGYTFGKQRLAFNDQARSLHAGSDGYVNVLSISIDNSYANGTMSFEIGGRTYYGTAYLSLVNSESVSGTSIANFKYVGEGSPNIIAEPGTSSWSDGTTTFDIRIYVQKTEKYDQPCCTHFATSNYQAERIKSVLAPGLFQTNAPNGPTAIIVL